MASLRHLARSALVDLAVSLESGRLVPPYTSTAVGRHVHRDARDEAAAAIQALAAVGMQPPQIAAALRLVAEERAGSQAVGDRADLVWTGPDHVGAQSRSTATVVRELFGSAETSVLMASYAIDSPKKAALLFAPLADRMVARPDLEVRVFVNIPRPWRNEEPESVLLRQFADGFRQAWPGERRPDVFHDPRALAVGVGERACLHAKCLVVDDEHVLISSANFTEAAHERNIEAGVVLHDAAIAVALRNQFDALVRTGAVARIPGIS